MSKKWFYLNNMKSIINILFFNTILTPCCLSLALTNHVFNKEILANTSANIFKE